MEETTSARMDELRWQVDSISMWVLTPVEVYSALARSFRTARITEAAFNQSQESWQFLKQGIQVVDQMDLVIERAYRCLRTHPLKAADALQLAAALVTSLDAPHRMGFVTLDSRLAEAASKEGFQVMAK